MSEKVLRYTIPQSSGSGPACIDIQILTDTGFHCMDLVEIYNVGGGSSSSSPGADITLKTTGWSNPPLPTSDEVIAPGKSWASGNGTWSVDGANRITVCGDPGYEFVVRFTGSVSSCP